MAPPLPSGESCEVRLVPPWAGVSVAVIASMRASLVGLAVNAGVKETVPEPGLAEGNISSWKPSPTSADRRATFDVVASKPGAAAYTVRVPVRNTPPISITPADPRSARRRPSASVARSDGMIE